MAAFDKPQKSGYEIQKAKDVRKFGIIMGIAGLLTFCCQYLFATDWQIANSHSALFWKVLGGILHLCSQVSIWTTPYWGGGKKVHPGFIIWFGCLVAGCLTSLSGYDATY